MVSHQRVEQELRVAGDIQGSFLPDHFPEVAGWRLSGVLVSARDTSGDFFDFFTVPDGRVAVVVADVADKGVGAALYMALSRAYLRSQAMENDPDPAKALAALNRRVLVDTSSDLFVTVFYGLVTPNQDEFVYANAGHPPAFRGASGSLSASGVFTAHRDGGGGDARCHLDESQRALEQRRFYRHLQRWDHRRAK